MSLLISLLYSRLPLSPGFLKCLTFGIRKVEQFFRNSSIFDEQLSNKLIELNSITSNRSLKWKVSQTPAKLSALVVSAEKDFELLDDVLDGIIFALNGGKHVNISIIVPDKFISDSRLKRLQEIHQSITIIPENRILDCESIRSVFSTKFRGRENWCLQQLIKFFYVIGSDDEYVLVVDADTVLIRKISWVDQLNRFALMPTIEYQPQYYEVLQKLGVIKQPQTVSFVPHHMLFKVDTMRTISKRVGGLSPDQFARLLTSLGNSESESPFSVDYELFGQYVSENEPGSFFYHRWANLVVSRKTFLKVRNSKILLRALSLFFNSISLHSWSNLQK